MDIPLNLVPNPTDEQRHEMLRESLSAVGRSEDYENIINALRPPDDIKFIAPLGELRGIRIGIIGGGLAGLTAAYELRKLGAQITIHEANMERIGGRVYTHYFDSERKYYGEFGAMRFPVSHETTWHYINLFNLGTRSLTSPRRNNFYYVHNTRLRTTESVQDILYPLFNLTERERNTPWPELHDYAFNYILEQMAPNVRLELLSILTVYSQEIEALMYMSIREALEYLDLSQEAISLISGINSPNGATLDISYDEVLQQEYTMDFINTYQMDGGNTNLPLAFYNSFTAEDLEQYYSIPTDMLGTVEYRAGHYVNGIFKTNNGKVTLRYNTEPNGKDTLEVYDYIICCIPFSSLRTVEIKPYFSNIKMQSILELNYINAMKTNFLCNQRFWEMDTPFGNMIGGISFTDLPIQSIIYPPDHNLCMWEGACSPEEPGVLLASYNLNQNANRVANMEEVRRFEFIKQNVEEVHGLPRGYLNSIIADYKTVAWYNEPYLRGALAYTLPGQKRTFAYIMKQPEFEQRVYFAGEHISNKHGWMQGSLQTGKAAANELALYHYTRFRR
ncbi:monoamine oxidase [Mobilisporobacter senegalensis]|uniref:Monoamine oxidase n=1 Tax=Mobilisporobacter senegalensis TaxID=1329262 RepID=A0A3N1XKM0_9FIRM|nr:NAD(P)/FAD-dependent oxidoreductase [Mobilisporobacter senegalensis]ROR27253.1 monoamine oxidase [Mobilisporobacter senegalensis]